VQTFKDPPFRFNETYIRDRGVIQFKGWRISLFCLAWTDENATAKSRTGLTVRISAAINEHDLFLHLEGNETFEAVPLTAFLL
jgi:hypothetical protein